MNSLKILAIGALVVLIIAAFVDRNITPKPAKNAKPAGNGFAVLELFTSEGCSGCPAADELLARIQKDTVDKPIYVLAYHVDYWNSLGWKDQFSSRQFSERQRTYSRQFAGQVYTPQVIINGKAECIGSDRSALNDAIKTALSEPAAASLTIAAKLDGEKLILDYQSTGSSNDNKLLFALVQKHAVSKVEKGENEGRTLAHAQIVRVLDDLDLSPNKAGRKELDVPPGFNDRDWEVIGLLQSQETCLINAVARARFN